MKNYFLLKYYISLLKEYIFIFSTATILLFISFTKSFSEENVFTINNVIVKGPMDLNFSRDKYINKAFIDSFEALMSKVLLSKDLHKVMNVKLKKIKNLISSFQIYDESYRNNKYEATFNIFYNDIKIKKFLGRKNISFSEPKKISVIFFPLLIIDDEIRELDQNFFYREWLNINIKNELINFILPLEDLDDISKMTEIKNKIEEINVDDFVNKYDIKNYVFALMDYQNKKLDIYLKTNFYNNKVSKNISYDVNDINNEVKLDYILRDLKMKITDPWKEKNIVNLSTPLILKIKFNHKKLKELDKLKKTFYSISIIDNYSLDEFSINNSVIKIYYYGNPKRLRTELVKFGYRLKNDQGFWELYKDE